jgi:hypothetical protein
MSVLACATVSTANAANILFARVSSASYVADGQDLVDYLTAGGHTVTYVDLNAAVIADFSTYSQVWVYDLVTGPDNSANQTANYANIAGWYNGLTNKNLITDGRIISSSDNWVAGGEPAWIRNYATQLDGVGGGLVLGTDHDVFQAGINTINSLIGIDPFTGFYFTPPLEATVDPLSPLYLATLNACSAAPAEKCINDNSSTGFVPTGIQPNGQFLTPVAYHGVVSQAFNNAAVSSTFGSATFPVSEPSTVLLLALAGLGFARRRKLT